MTDILPLGLALPRSRNDFLQIPLSKRRAKAGKSLIKIVRLPEGKFLSEWTFEDIGKELFGVISKRPVVYLQSSYEALEKAYWCYSHGMVPLIGELEPSVANYTAQQYEVDQLIVDDSSLVALRPFVDSLPSKLSAISVLGGSFDLELLGRFSEKAVSLRLVLALPETGVIATAEYAQDPIFSVASDCYVHETSVLTVTKGHLMTPLLKYDTGIPIVVRRRAGGAVASFTL